jgi:hypothetical protein
MRCRTEPVQGLPFLNGEIVPLGPKARNLNKDFAYPGGPETSLAHWTQAAFCRARRTRQRRRRAGLDDEAAPLDARARAWLDVNCAHCHRREGPASNSGLFLTWGEQDPVALGIAKRPVAAGRGSGDRTHV